MLDLNKIYQGDCLELMKDITEKSIDLIVTDPPYFLPVNHYSTRKQFSRNFSDLGILEHFFKEIFAQYQRIIKEDGTLYIFCDGQSYPLFYYYLYPFCKSVRPLIWDKKTSINGYGWRHQHELIIFAEMPKVKPIPTGDGDILKYSAVKVDNREHPAEKPVELFCSLIQKSSIENDLVLDSFTGSGTTAIACLQTNRNFIGMELEPKYCEIAQNRINNFTKQLTMV